MARPPYRAHHAFASDSDSVTHLHANPCPRHRAENPPTQTHAHGPVTNPSAKPCQTNSTHSQHHST